MIKTHAIFRMLLLCALLLFPFSRVSAAAVTASIHTASIHTFAASSVLSDGHWVKIAVEENGIYQITDAELKKMGFSDPDRVGVFGFGGHLLDEAFSNPHIDDLPEVAVYRDSRKGRILFYARGVTKWEYKGSSTGFVHTNNPYSVQGCYFLHQKDEAAREMKRSPQGSGAEVDLTAFDDYALHETDLENVGGTGREMYGESFLYTRTRDFKFSLPGITTDPGKLTVNFIAKNSAVSTLTQQINGKEIRSASISAIGSDKYQQAQEMKSITAWTPDGNATTTVRLTYNPGGGTASLAFLNYVRLNMKRSLAPQGNYLLFRSVEAAQKRVRFNLSGVNASMQVWDVTHPTDILQQELSMGNDQTASFVPSLNGLREYALVCTEETFPSVSALGRVNNQNLHALPQTDLVIVVQPGLKSEAERLASYRRERDGLHVTVVHPEAIYNEFSSGTPDATAIRLFMKQFYDRSEQAGTPPRYLLLFGDGSYDNRSMNTALWKPAAVQHNIITYQSELTLNETESYVCDDYFGFLDDGEGGKRDALGYLTLASDKVDVGIGRFPVRTLAQAKTVVDKVIAYSGNKTTGSWKNQITLLGDDGDNNIHMKHADSMATIIQDKGLHQFVFNKIYLDAYKREITSSGTAYPDVRKRFFDQLQAGSLLVNYSGHGATTSLTHEKIFKLSDAESITMKRLPVWVTATCDFSRFDHPETSAGEALLLNPNGGAIAMFTTTRVVYSNGNLRINHHLIENIFTKHADGTRYAIGDIMKIAKCALGTDANKLNFVLLGDPSMKMAYPEQEMELTEINGQPVTGEPVLLKALSRVTMKGRVLKTGSEETDADFTGIVMPTVFDCEETVTAVDNDKTDRPFVFRDRSRRLFAGRDSVRHGEFEFSFIVPKDISYSMESGMVNLYAVDERNNEAQGYFDNYLLGGTEGDVAADTTPPAITALYLNSQFFRNGDVVNPTPYLVAFIADESGINTSGNGIGHDLTATITGNGVTQRYILNDYFVNQTGETGKGSVQFSIPTLPEGAYSLELKVWDVYNNSRSETITFVVKNDVKPELFDLRADRNPAREQVRFLLSHNRPEASLHVRLQVYTQMGQCVWEEQLTGSSEFMSEFPITWNLEARSGGRVQPGIYIYRAAISDNGEHFTTKSRKLIVLGR
ncbi:MAG: type IX secretion system sortase PorU [Bacteroidales bacterium]